MKVQDIIHISECKFDAVHKSVGVLLHDMGFMRYGKLTQDNYNYWWYEAEEPPFNSRIFTYDWADMELTGNFDFLLKLTKFHKQKESIYNIINNALNLLSAMHEGINMITGRKCYDEVFDMYYGRWKPEPVQLKLF